jgi:hypothetical protein
MATRLGFNIDECWHKTEIGAEQGGTLRDWEIHVPSVHNSYVMAKYRVAIIVALLFLAVISAPAQTKWERVSSFQFDWDGHPGVKVLLDIPQSEAGADVFKRIRIRVPGHKEFVLVNNLMWVKYGSEDAETSPGIRKAKSLVPSPYVLALQAAENRTLLLLVGWAYGSSPGHLDVIEISDAGEPQVVFHQDEFGLLELRDLDGDGIAEIIGYPCLSQGWGNDLLTYDPFNIYKLGATSATAATLSIPLSKSYNLKHYYGWAGPTCSEDIAVVLHPPKGGKPILMNAKKAQKLMEGKP